MDSAGKGLASSTVQGLATIPVLLVVIERAVGSVAEGLREPLLRLDVVAVHIGSARPTIRLPKCEEVSQGSTRTLGYILVVGRLQYVQQRDAPQIPQQFLIFWRPGRDVPEDAGGVGEDGPILRLEVLHQLCEASCFTELPAILFLLHYNHGEVFQDATDVLDYGCCPRGTVVRQKLDQLLDPERRRAYFVAVFDGVGGEVPEGTGEVLNGWLVFDVIDCDHKCERSIALQQRLFDVGGCPPGEVSEHLRPAGYDAFVLLPQVVHERLEALGKLAEGGLVVDVSVGEVDQNGDDRRDDFGGVADELLAGSAGAFLSSNEAVVDDEQFSRRLKSTETEDGRSVVLLFVGVLVELAYGNQEGVAGSLQRIRL